MPKEEKKHPEIMKKIPQVRNSVTQDQPKIKIFYVPYFKTKRRSIKIN